MHNTYIAADRIFATVLWVIAAVLVCLDVGSPINSGDAGLLIGMGATAVSVKGYVLRLERREIRAFELGRESMRQ